MTLPIRTKTGKDFAQPEDALVFIRECGEKMLDPNVSQVESGLATAEMLYTFKALDEYLRRGGYVPDSWRWSHNPFAVQGGGPHDVLDMS